MISRVDFPLSGTAIGEGSAPGFESCEVKAAGTLLLPFDFDLALLWLAEGNRAGVRGTAFGRCSAKILIIAARCMPASTAKTDPFDHCVAVDLTRRPVTLSSVGPPPAPFQ